MQRFITIILFWTQICAAISWKQWVQTTDSASQMHNDVPIGFSKRQESHSIDLIPGPKVSIGPAKYQIINTTWIYAPGSISPKIQGDMFFWSGLYGDESHEDDDSLRIVTEAHAPRYMKRSCNAEMGQWCLKPSVVHGCCLSQSPNAVAIDSGNRFYVEMHKRDGPGGLWHQSVKDVSHGKKQLFSYLKGNGPMKSFGVFLQSNSPSTGSSDIQSFWNISIFLEDPDPDFGKTVFQTNTIQMVPPVTNDGGRSWLISYMMIPPMIRG